MEFELSETYRFDPSEYDATGRRIKDEVRFRDVIKEFEIDFHRLHSADYALNLYANARTMHHYRQSSVLLYPADAEGWQTAEERNRHGPCPCTLGARLSIAAN